MERPDDRCGVGAEGASHLHELNHIQTSLTALVLRDVRLRAVETSGNYHLRQPGSLPSLHQQLAKTIMLPSERRPGHDLAVMIRSVVRLSQNRISIVVGQTKNPDGKGRKARS